jgi:hypothetical protein
METIDRLTGGMGDKKDPRKFDPTQLGMGIQHEMEHTDDPAIAIEVCMDHLTEDPAYYTKLEKIEETIKEIVKAQILF